MSTTPYLLRRVEAIREDGGVAPGWRQQDLEDLVRDVVETVDERMRFGRIEVSLIAEAQVDLDSLRRAIALFRELDATAFSAPAALGDFDARSGIGRLERLVASIEGPEQLEEMEVGLRLEVTGDSGFEWLLCAISDVTLVSSALERLLQPKIALLTDEQVMGLWGSVAAESNAERDHSLERAPDIVTEEFFVIASPNEARQRLTHYVANIRPRLERRMMERGVTRFPVGPPGIAKTLSWTASASTVSLSALERQALRSLSRIAVCCELLPRMDAKALAAAARLREDGYALGGRGFREARRRWGDNRHDASVAERAMLAELETLLRVSDEMHAPTTPLETVLRSFKLGLEVMAREVARDLRGKNEVALQRLLCRFLVERGFHAFGTKFGWSEADLQVEDVFGALVIEAKLARRPPASALIVKWLSQLKSYMDQSPMKQRGALVVFNFSAVPIVAPPQFIHARHLILPINICSVSPSKRTECIDIAAAPAGSDNLVQITRLPSAARTLNSRSRQQRGP